MSVARRIDDLVLSRDGEEARARARDAIVDGIPVDVDPYEPEPEYVTQRRAAHDRAMLRAFPAHNNSSLMAMRRTMKESGRWAPKYPDWLAGAWGDESEADLSEFPLRLPEPEVRDGEILWGASATIAPVARLDPECAWEARDVPTLPPSSAVAQDVAAWLETFYEPMTARDLVELTGHSQNAVRAALAGLREAGLVARQDVGAVYRDDSPQPSRQVWIWRRLA